MFYVLMSILLSACCGNLTPRAVDYGKSYKTAPPKLKQNLLALFIGLVSILASAKWLQMVNVESNSGFALNVTLLFSECIQGVKMMSRTQTSEPNLVGNLSSSRSFEQEMKFFNPYFWTS